MKYCLLFGFILICSPAQTQIQINSTDTNSLAMKSGMLLHEPAWIEFGYKGLVPHWPIGFRTECEFEYLHANLEYASNFDTLNYLSFEAGPFRRENSSASGWLNFYIKGNYTTSPEWANTILTTTKILLCYRLYTKYLKINLGCGPHLWDGNYAGSAALIGFESSIYNITIRDKMIFKTASFKFDLMLDEYDVDWDAEVYLEFYSRKYRNIAVNIGVLHELGDYNSLVAGIYYKHYITSL